MILRFQDVPLLQLPEEMANSGLQIWESQEELKKSLLSQDLIVEEIAKALFIWFQLETIQIHGKTQNAPEHGVEPTQFLATFQEDMLASSEEVPMIIYHCVKLKLMKFIEILINFFFII